MRRRLRRPAPALSLAALLLLSCAAPAAAQEATPAAAPAAPQPALATVSGRVLDAQTQQPVAGAVVYLPDLKMGMVTDHTGGFVFQGVPVGEHRWRINRIGFATWEEDGIAVADGDWYNIRLLSRPEVLEGIQVVAASLNNNRAVGLDVRTLDRTEIITGSARNAVEVVQRQAGLAITRCTASPASAPDGTMGRGGPAARPRGATPDGPPPPATFLNQEQRDATRREGAQRMADSQESCVSVRGQQIRANIFLDDQRTNADGLVGIMPDELYAVDVYSGGRAVYVYTQRYIEHLARRRLRPQPVMRF